jgi:hypothetical protein
LLNLNEPVGLTGLPVGFFEPWEPVFPRTVLGTLLGWLQPPSRSHPHPSALRRVLVRAHVIDGTIASPEVDVLLRVWA